MKMGQMILGLLLFLGVHSTRIFADDWRTRTMARIGRNTWKALYSMLSLAGFVLLVWGFAVVREQPLMLWMPPAAMRHVAAVLTLVAFVLLTATYVPRNGIQARLHHPMALGVMVWALAHLLANGALAHVVLFGAILVWSVLSFRAARQRDRREGTPYPAGVAVATAATWVLGVLFWLVFVLWLHGLLIGIRPLF